MDRLKQYTTSHGDDLVTVNLCQESALQSYATRAPSPTDIVLTPEQLHRRNLKRRLAEADQPWSSLKLCSPADLATRVVGVAEGRPAETLDRTDRLRLLEDVLETTPGDTDRLHMLYGSRLSAKADEIEAARSELALLAGSQLDRLADLEAVCSELDGVAEADARDYVAGIADLQRALRDETNAYLSDAALMQAGRDTVEETGGDAWRDVFGSIDRVHLAGVSTLGTPLLEFLVAVARETDTDVELFLRAGTGPRIADRLLSRLSLDQPGDTDTGTREEGSPADHLTCPATEIIAETRQEEARVAMAVVEGLLQRGVSISDIVVVARDADAYERPLSRTANVYGRHLSVWTQLELKRTLPYRLVVETTRILAADDDAVDAETMFRPLVLQWVHPDATSESVWPLSSGVVNDLRRSADTETACSLSEWRERLLAVESLDHELRAAVREYIAWMERQPTDPDGDDILATLAPLIDAFDAVVFPEREADDSPVYNEIARTARAIQRVAGDDTDEHLLRETRAKYRDWLDRGHVTQSWDTVLEIVDAIASTRPGRREHANADRVDVLDATDTWSRSYPYVVAVGCVGGEWPQQPHGACPPALRAAIRAGTTSEATRLPVRGAWTTARDRDHFADAVSTPTEHLILTRYTQDSDGVEYERSPFLDALDVTEVPDEAVHALVSPETHLPDRIDPQTAASKGAPTATAGEAPRDAPRRESTMHRGGPDE